MTMAPFQIIQTHALNNGAFLTGVDPNGTDSGLTLLRGRYRKWSACTDGGLFYQPFEATMDESMSGRVRTIMWNLPGVTNILFSWVEAIGGLTIPFYPPAGTASVVSGFLDPQQTIMILPRGALKVTGTGPLTAAGAITIMWEDGILQDGFNAVGTIGSWTGHAPLLG